MKDLYAENCMMFIEEIEEDTNKWKYFLCSWIARINIIKMSMIPKAIYRFSAIPIKIFYQNGILQRTRTNNSKI